MTEHEERELEERREAQRALSRDRAEFHLRVYGRVLAGYRVEQGRMDLEERHCETTKA